MSNSDALAMEQIHNKVFAAMQDAEEMGGPTGVWYQVLMHKIAREALGRAEVHRNTHADELGALAQSYADHGLQLRQCQPLQELAYDCVSAGRYDEGLLHLGMLGVYMNRLAQLPIMKIDADDFKRIVEALDYQFDMTENTAEDEKNKALVSKLLGA